MQEKLFIERIEEVDSFRPEKYIKGQRSSDYLLKVQLEAFSRSFIKLAISKDNIKNVGVQIDKTELRKYFNERCPQVSEDISKDFFYNNIVATSCCNYYLYKTNPNKKKYIVSDNLAKFLRSLNIDIPIDAFPKEFSAYFQFNNVKDEDGNGLKCAFFNIIKELEGNRRVYISAISRAMDKETLCYFYTHSSFFFYLTKDFGYKTLEEFVKDNSIKPVKSLSLDDRMLFNLMLYISNNNEELKEEYNLFSSKLNKKKTQMKIYSNESFFKVGYNNDAEFLKMTITKNTEVRAYWKNQAYGPKRSLRKYILCRGYIRKNISYIDKKS